MKIGFLIVVPLLAALATPAFAHQLDEYLQATTLDVSKDSVGVDIRLTPGVAVLPMVLPKIDADRDGIISEAEQRTYAERMLSDIAMTIDGQPVQLHLTSSTFPSIDRMKEGLGEIVLRFNATMPPVQASNRTLIFKNHHERGISAYLANCLMPSDPNIRILAQKRNYSQSSYQLDFAYASGSPGHSRPLLTAFAIAGAGLLLLGGAYSIRVRLK